MSNLVFFSRRNPFVINWRVGSNYMPIFVVSYVQIKEVIIAYYILMDNSYIFCTFSYSYMKTKILN
jgi:hypothetical protein